MVYLKLFWEFLKIGMFSVGGGMATLPFLYDLGEKTGWFSSAQVADMLAVSESTPGPIGINMATYVGYTVGGPLGSVLASVGIILPGIALVLIITAMLEKFRNNRYVEGAFYGLRPASVALITAAGLLVAKITFLDEALLEAYSGGVSGGLLDLISWKAVILAAALLVLTRWWGPTKKLHPVFFIALSAVIGIAFSF
ncbi:MAG: chromate transporter [Firmicutes bacterium]|nr:chromate transporter [Bacillota bacterium]